MSLLALAVSFVVGVSRHGLPDHMCQALTFECKPHEPQAGLLSGGSERSLMPGFVAFSLGGMVFERRVLQPF